MRKFLTTLALAATVLLGAASSRAEEAPATIRFGASSRTNATPRRQPSAARRRM